MRTFLDKLFCFVLLACIVLACSDPQCPRGRYREDDFCHLCAPDLMYVNGNCVAPEDSGIDGGSDPTDAAEPEQSKVDAQGSVDGRVNDPQADASCDSCLPAGDCTPGACQAGQACQVDTDCTAGLCDPITSRCAIRECAPLCPAGSPCTSTAECAPGNVCDPKAKLCLVSSCAGGDLQNEADLKRVRYCQHVNGTLSMAYVAGSPSTVLDLRYLKTVTGSLSLTGATLSALRLDALESIGADLVVGMLDTELVHAPELLSVAGSLTLGLGTFTSVQLPKLRSVGKDLSLQYLTYANTINIGALSMVGGNVFMSRLPLVPWSSLVHLQPQGVSSSVSEIGCNVCPDIPSNRYMCSSGTGC